MNINGKYRHFCATPIKVLVNGVVEDFYSILGPHYNPRLLPVKTDNETTIYYQWYSNYDGYWSKCHV